jgi:CRISPR/Cas system-associated exonuclease Cas4 (RecB family)
MAKSLLSEVMAKPIQKKIESFLNSDDLIAKINSGYTINRVAKETKKKSFAPSTLAFSHGECARYWYLAFDGGVFEDNADAYGAANMTAGTKSHERIQEAMGNVPGFLVDSEFKVVNNDPPIYGFGDVMLNWDGEELLGEIKTMPSEGFEYRKSVGKPKTGHLIQLIIYMKILKKARAVLIYENKNNHELLILPVEVNDYYIGWVDRAFDWMRTVRKAWEDRTLPEKNYRSNSKICKTCPISKMCADAGIGDIKLNALEPIDETMSMV